MDDFTDLILIARSVGCRWLPSDVQALPWLWVDEAGSWGLIGRDGVRHDAGGVVPPLPVGQWSGAFRRRGHTLRSVKPLRVGPNFIKRGFTIDIPDGIPVDHLRGLIRLTMLPAQEVDHDATAPSDAAEPTLA